MTTQEIRAKYELFDQKQRNDQRGTHIRQIARLKAELAEAESGLVIVNEIDAAKAHDSEARIADVVRCFRKAPFVKFNSLDQKRDILQRIADDNGVAYDEVVGLVADLLVERPVTRTGA